MSDDPKTGNKGFVLEEVLRAYFLRAGFFVIRGAPYVMYDEEITDIDLWLYERSSSAARRCQIVDIKYKNKPKAMERLLWTKGLMETLDIHGAYVATTDRRGTVRRIANKLNINLLDGNDLQRIKESGKVLFEDRITEEMLLAEIRKLDKQRQTKELQNELYDLRSFAVVGVGANALVRCLESFSLFTRKAIESHPNPDAARIYARMSYLSASFIAINLDYIGADASFRTNEERREIFINAIRYGNQDHNDGWRDIYVACNLIRRYIDNGSAIAARLDRTITQEFEKIPAEIIADQVQKFGKGDGLFHVARSLEAHAYNVICPNFDNIDISLKTFMGALLDYCSIDRTAFALAWIRPQITSPKSPDRQSDHDEHGDAQSFLQQKKSNVGFAPQDLFLNDTSPEKPNP